ncbi:MAG: PQQ-binding-like beta-propeller repeat protein [Ignavibacteriaceae bacterium]|jgi:outer membrane protein assembly factor BamB|nr:PQQ-binding-like beta-propeller repeat protein [Ignavibacteriaceae bacterium]
MKRISQILLLLFLVGCSKPLILKRITFNDTQADKTRNYINNYYFDIALKDSFVFKKEISIKGNLDINPFFFYDSYLFFGGLAGKFYIVDIESNTLIGDNQFNGSINVPPILSNYRLFIPLNNYDENYATLYFYDILNNKVLSETKIDGNIDFSIMKYNENIIVINNRGLVYRINLAGGLESKHKLISELISEPILLNDIIYYIGFDGSLYSFSLIENNAKIELEINDLQKIFSFNKELILVKNNSYAIVKVGNISEQEFMQVPLNNIQSGVSDTNRLYFVNYSGNTICIDKNNHNIIWETKLSGFTNLPLVLTDDYLLVTNSIGEIYFINKEDGKEYTRIKVEERIKTAPQIYDNKIYFGVAKGLIKVYEKANNK